MPRAGTLTDWKRLSTEVVEIRKMVSVYRERVLANLDDELTPERSHPIAGA